MKIAVYSCHNFEMPFLEKYLLTGNKVIFIEQELNEYTVALANSCEAVSLFTSDKADANVLEKLSALGIKYIALRSVGFDHVDIAKARSLNISVTNVPAYSPYAVAEHAVTLLMALNRHLILSQELIRKNDFRLDGLTGFDLHEKTVGIIGLGNIGNVFAKIMTGFGCKILCYDPHVDPNTCPTPDLHFTDLKNLCANSDIISVHCPLNKSTKHLLNAELFSIMKKGVFIINTARGSIIKTEDLFPFIENGTIGGIGLDVYEYEKGLFFRDHTNSTFQDPLFQKLISYKNVMITAHQAFLTQTALQNIAETTAGNLKCMANSLPCKNELTAIDHIKN